jgi:hypothetical protein
MVIGFGLCFFGNFLKLFTLFTMGLTTGFGALVVVMAQFVIASNTGLSAVRVLLVASAVFGLLLGYLTTSAIRVGTFLMGMWVGIIVSLLLNNTFFYRTSKEWVLWTAMGCIGLFFGIVGVWLKSRITIISSALVGAYLMIRPLGWYIGHWPNEFLMVTQI